MINAALMKQARTLLDNHHFPGMSLDDLTKVLMAGEVRAYGNGAPLCREGEPGEHLYFLLTGRVKVLHSDSAGRQRHLSNIDAPALVGHMALVDGSMRSATCLVEGSAQAVTLSRENYGTLLHESGTRGTTLRRLLISSLCSQLAAANSHIQNMLNPPEITEEVEATSNDNDAPQAQRAGAPKPNQRGDSFSEKDVLAIAAKLGGWSSDLNEIEELELVADDRLQQVKKKRRP